MPTELNSLLLRFNRLSPREKILVTAMLILSLWAGWDTLIHQSQQKQKKELQASVQSLQNALNTQQQLAEQLKNTGQQNGGAKKLEEVKQSVNHLKQQLYAGEKKFVPPEKMAEALQDILRQNGNLRLIQLETLPVKPFGTEDQPVTWVYRHSLSLVVEGDFFSTLDYLRSLEALPWRVQWDSVDYKVTGYPNAETRLQVYTLSFEKDWLGA
jgi:MSHA biogenesis protein MshJ